MSESTSEGGREEQTSHSGTCRALEAGSERSSRMEQREPAGEGTEE